MPKFVEEAAKISGIDEDIQEPLDDDESPSAEQPVEEISENELANGVLIAGETEKENGGPRADQVRSEVQRLILGRMMGRTPSQKYFARGSYPQRVNHERSVRYFRARMSWIGCSREKHCENILRAELIPNN